MEFKYFMIIIWRRKWTFVLVFLLSLLIPLIVSSFSEKIYKISSRLMINRVDIQSRFLSILPTSIGDLSFLDADNYYETYLELFKDYSVLKQVIDELNLNVESDSFFCSYPYLSFMTFSQSCGVKVDRVEESDIFEINGYSTSPMEAEKIANSLLNAFVKRFENILHQAAFKIKKLIEGYNLEIERNLNEAEQQKKVFLCKHGIVNFDSQLEKEYDVILSCEKDLHNVNVDLQTSEEEQNAINKALGKIPEFQKKDESIRANPIIDKAKDQLSELMWELAGKKLEFTEEHPEIISIKRKIKAIKTTLKTEFKKNFNSETIEKNDYYNTLSNRYSDNEIKKITNLIFRDIIKEQIDFKRKQVTEISNNNIQLGRINDTIKRLKARLEENLNSIEAANIVEKMEVNNSTVIYYANHMLEGAKPYFPSSSSKKIVFICGFLGIGLAFFVAIFFDYLDDSCKNKNEVEHALNFPVITSIPKKMFYKLNQAIFENQRYKKIKESYYNLFLSLNLKGSLKKDKIIAITSPTPREGKTTSAFFLARAMAESGEKVLLVETNMKRPVLSGIYGIKQGYTLDLLLENQAFEGAATEFSPNMDFIAARKIDNPVGIFISGKMEMLLNRLKEKDYDRIILDLPSLSDDKIASMLSYYADITIMIVALGKCSCKKIKDSFDELKKDKDESRLKIVINKEKEWTYWGL